MSILQRVILLFGLTLFVLAGLFPPLVEGWRFCGVTFISRIGYYTGDRMGCVIDVPRLIVLWIVIAVPTAVLVVAFGRSKRQMNVEGGDGNDAPT